MVSMLTSCGLCLTLCVCLDVFSTTWSLNIGTCLKCPDSRPARRFRACKLVKLRTDLKKIKKAIQNMDKKLKSKYDIQAEDLTSRGQPVIFTSSVVDLLNVTYSDMKTIYIQVKFMKCWRNTGVKKHIRSKLSSLDKRLQTVLCGVGAVIGHGLLLEDNPRHAEQCFSEEFLDIPNIDSDMVNYSVNFVAETIFVVEKLMSNVNHLLENDIEP